MFTEAGLKNLQQSQSWLTPEKRKELDDLSPVVGGLFQTVNGVPGKTGGIVQKVDALEKLTGGWSPKLVDPKVASMFDANTTPQPNPQTPDQHRLSISVLNADKTSFHLGAEQTAGKDRGIRGLTEHHVHFEVTDETQTFVTLGAPMTEPAHKEQPGKSVALFTHGYAMGTAGSAWHVSHNQQVAMSTDDNIIVTSHGAGKSAVLHSWKGPVSIAAAQDVSMGTIQNVWIGADPGGVVEATEFGKFYESGPGKWLTNKMAKSLLTLGDFVASMQAVMAKEDAVQKTIKAGKNGWADQPKWSLTKQLVDVGKILSTVLRYADDLDKSTVGKVSITATTYAGLTGDIAASVFGNLSASLSSVVSASVLGGTASVKGLAWSSLWSGMGTSVKSYKNVEVKAEKGELKMQGEKVTEVSCAGGDLKLGAKGNTQLCADEQVFVNGKRGVKVTAAEGESLGMIIDPSIGMLYVGEVSKVESLKDATAKKSVLVFAKDSYTSLSYDTCNTLRMDNEKAELLYDGYGLTLRSDGSHLDGEKVLLG
jgi:hypothetical protein